MFGQVLTSFHMEGQFRDVKALDYAFAITDMLFC
jgi:hypothetical protein